MIVKVQKENLATLEVVSNLLPAYDKEGNIAERIEKLELEGYSFPILVQKGLHKLGDKVIYIKWDSCLPNNSLFETFISSGKLGSNNRVKVVKLLGQPSFGIVLPLQEVRDFIYSQSEEVTYINNDYTELLGIHKIEDIPQNLDAKGNFPEFLYKTDEPNIYGKLEGHTSCKSVIEQLYFDKEELQITQKRDGSSITIYCKKIEGGYQVGVCSRNLELKLDCNNQYVNAVNQYNLIEKLSLFCKEWNTELALRGELVGVTQKKKNNPDSNGISKIIFFGLDDISKGFAERIPSLGSDLASLYTIGELFNLETTPIIKTGVMSWEEILEYATNYFKDNLVEGIVIRTTSSNKLSCKLINPNYDIK